MQSRGYPRHVERTVIVRDKKRENERVFLDLPDLLPLFEPEGHAWRWALRDVPELAGVWRWDFNFAYIEQEVPRDPRGLTFSFEELLAFGERAGQVIWGQFVAARVFGELPPRNVPDAEVGRTTLAALTAFDSSYWFVGGPSAVIDRALRVYDDVEEIDPSDWSCGE